MCTTGPGGTHRESSTQEPEVGGNFWVLQNKSRTTKRNTVLKKKEKTKSVPRCSTLYIGAQLVTGVVDLELGSCKVHLISVFLGHDLKQELLDGKPGTISLLTHNLTLSAGLLGYFLLLYTQFNGAQAWTTDFLHAKQTPHQQGSLPSLQGNLPLNQGS